MANKQPARISRLANLIKETHNPFGEESTKRNDWIKTGHKKGPKILYFTGCTAAYREKDIAQDTVSILEQLGYSVEIISDERCCGSPLFRTGNQNSGFELAKHNIEILNQSDAESILVTCPGCYYALTSDYSENGFDLNKPVQHISEFLLKSLKKIPKGKITESITYHDPCHLGRHSGIYDAPREIIKRVSDSNVVEMERNRENAMCCGNGAGLRTLFPDHAKKIGAERIRHAKNVGARYLVTSCPFCKNMLSSQSGSDITVLDIPELVMMIQNGQYDKTD
jgi:heterodisulfide reductase subunit D